MNDHRNYVTKTNKAMNSVTIRCHPSHHVRNDKLSHDSGMSGGKCYPKTTQKLPEVKVPHP